MSVASCLDLLRQKGGIPWCEIPKVDRPAWQQAIDFGFVRKFKHDRMWWLELTDEAHKG